MDVIEAIMTRRSIRKYQDKPVEKERSRTLMEAAMPRPAQATASPAVPLDHGACPPRQVVGGPPLRGHAQAVAPGRPGLRGPLAGEVSGQLAPGLLGRGPEHPVGGPGRRLGTVWTGLYPDEARMEAVQDILRLPERSSRTLSSPWAIRHRTPDAPTATNRSGSTRTGGSAKNTTMAEKDIGSQEPVPPMPGSILGTMPDNRFWGLGPQIGRAWHDGKGVAARLKGK